MRTLTEWWGHPVDVDFHFHGTDLVEEALRAAGLPVEAKLERAPYPAEAETRRGYLLARRPAAG